MEWIYAYSKDGQARFWRTAGGHSRELLPAGGCQTLNEILDCVSQGLLPLNKNESMLTNKLTDEEARTERLAPTRFKRDENVLVRWRPFDKNQFWPSLGHLDHDTAMIVCVLVEKFVEQSELCGSRGRAMMYCREDPKDDDYDFAVFTTEEGGEAETILRWLAANVSRMELRTIGDGGIGLRIGQYDLLVRRRFSRRIMLKMWELMEDGMEKKEAWRQAEAWAKTDVDIIKAELKAAVGL